MKYKKLNLGCGLFPKKGFINLDVNPQYPADVIHDLEVSPWPFKDNVFELIEMHHVLEHLTDIRSTMSELNRILKEGGELVICVPHFSRGFTHWDHKHGFDISFPFYFEKKMSGGFNNIEFIHVSTKLVWFGQPQLKKQYLTRSAYYIGIILGYIFDLLGNINHYFASRILCYWVGGYDEIEFIFKKNDTK